MICFSFDNSVLLIFETVQNQSYFGSQNRFLCQIGPLDCLSQRQNIVVNNILDNFKKIVTIP